MMELKMTRRKNLTDQEKMQICELRSKGWSMQRLAKKFECTEGSISWSCLMNGGIAPQNGKQPRKSLPKGFIRNGVIVRPFTKAEDHIITAMRLEGKGPVNIGKIIGRGHSAVIARLATLAKHDELEDNN